MVTVAFSFSVSALIISVGTVTNVLLSAFAKSFFGFSDQWFRNFRLYQFFIDFFIFNDRLIVFIQDCCCFLFCWKLIERKKFSLSWDNTVSVDRLLSTNALLFDGNIRGYYKDFSAFRKTHYFITSGLSVPIMRGKGVELSLRPFISYGLTPVLKNSSDKNMHFLQYGAGLRFLFPRKN